MRTKILKARCILLLIAICVTIIWGHFNDKNIFQEAYSDGIVQVDLDSIYLVGSGVQVDFSDVILSKHEETRKLIVSTQEATVQTELTDRLIRNFDFDFMKKTQTVSYTGKGYFVVDLDKLTEENIIEDKENKTLTLKIEHAHLETIEIDPEKVIIDDVKESLLAKGDIELTLKDYNSIEMELKRRLEQEFNTVKNGQDADTVALQMVKEIYEPLVRAINSSYTLYVEFQ